jgi:voltage-gated sodium channel
MAEAGFRARLAAFLDAERTRNAILGVIALNAVILGLETSQSMMAAAGGLLIALDKICLWIFVVELVLKLYAQGPRFFRQGWNIFDFCVVAIAFVPNAESLSVLRALRILRVLRVISVAPSLRKVVYALVSALPGMGSVILLMAIIFYIGGVMATTLFAASFPEWFGSIGASLYSLFQIMTLESWSMGIVRPVMETYAWAWAFFVPFILVTSFAVVNLMVGLIVNAMQEATDEENRGETEEKEAKLAARFDELNARLERIEAAVSRDR